MTSHSRAERGAFRQIGVIGGVGPLAGLDLVHKITAATQAARDQDHLPVALLSFPGRIPDRTDFLLGRTTDNPGHPLADVAQMLADIGSRVIGMPCNTAHAPAIFDVVRDRLAGRAELVHMIEEVGREIGRQFLDANTVGILATTGTVAAEIYPEHLGPLGYRVLHVSADDQERLVQAAIYDPEFGIKSTAAPTAEAVERLTAAVAVLKEQGADLVVLACTEIPLALRQPTVRGLPCLDPTQALARALVRRSAPALLVD